MNPIHFYFPNARPRIRISQREVQGQLSITDNSLPPNIYHLPPISKSQHFSHPICIWATFLLSLHRQRKGAHPSFFYSIARKASNYGPSMLQKRLFELLTTALSAFHGGSFATSKGCSGQTFPFFQAFRDSSRAFPPIPVHSTFQIFSFSCLVFHYTLSGRLQPP